MNPREFPLERESRIARIGERAKALKAVGYYGDDDLRALRNMIRNNVPLIEAEMLLYLAEQTLRDQKSATPVIERKSK